MTSRPKAGVLLAGLAKGILRSMAAEAIIIEAIIIRRARRVIMTSRKVESGELSFAWVPPSAQIN